jgi:AsmA protein
MRSVKILAVVAGGIVALIVAALLVVRLTVSPNEFKGKIANSVKESTGRDLVLKGDIKLSVFPWIALELGPASLGNPPGFGDETFLAFNHAAVRVRLLPLLAKRLEMDRVDLDGLELRLRKNAQGVGNWQDFGNNDQRAAPEAESRTSVPQLQLAGIHITNGRVSYQGIVIDKFDLETGAFGGSGATPVRLGLEANRGVLGESVTVNVKFSVTADAKMEELHLAGVSFSGLLTRPEDGRSEHWEISAPAMEANLKAQTLAVPDFAAMFSSARVTGKLTATKILDDLSATGSIALSPLVLHEFMPRLGIVLPKTTDPRALAQFSASSDFSYGTSGVKFEKLVVQLDDTHLKGDAALTGEPRAFKFDLTVDQINLDRYLSPDKNAPAPTKPPEKASKFPEAEGTLAVGSLHFSPLDFSNVRVTLASKDNVVHLFPSQAQIDGGSYSGNVTLDNRGAAPALAIDEHLSGVDMARLLAATSYKGRMSGRGNVNVKATARGAALPAVLQTLNGHFDANLSNGALEGMDLGYELKAAQALVKKEAPPSRSGPARTPFDACKLSAEIINGIAKTSDLLISSPVLRVGGQGSANLASKAIDFNLLASVLKAPGATMADIPLKITGTYVDPTIRPDVEALAKGQIKDKLKDVLKKNGLEGLFGK